jgi:hypothetical protein
MSGTQLRPSTQGGLLIEISKALVHGYISSEQAISLRQSVLSNPEKEERYLADHKLVPALGI